MSYYHHFLYRTALSNSATNWVFVKIYTISAVTIKIGFWICRTTPFYMSVCIPFVFFHRYQTTDSTLGVLLRWYHRLNQPETISRANLLLVIWLDATIRCYYSVFRSVRMTRDKKVLIIIWTSELRIEEIKCFSIRAYHGFFVVVHVGPCIT